MKKQIELNIGLASNTGPCAPHLILADLRYRGFTVTASRVALGQWEGKSEATLVIESGYVLPLEYGESKTCIRAALGEIARRHHQDCIAIQWPDGTGELIPPVSEFDPAYFHGVEKTLNAAHNFGTSFL